MARSPLSNSIVFILVKHQNIYFSSNTQIECAFYYLCCISHHPLPLFPSVISIHWVYGSSSTLPGKGEHGNPNCTRVKWKETKFNDNSQGRKLQAVLVQKSKMNLDYQLPQSSQCSQRRHYNEEHLRIKDGDATRSVPAQPVAKHWSVSGSQEPKTDENRHENSEIPVLGGSNEEPIQILPEEKTLVTFKNSKSFIDYKGIQIYLKLLQRIEFIQGLGTMQPHHLLRETLLAGLSQIPFLHINL